MIRSSFTSPQRLLHSVSRCAGSKSHQHNVVLYIATRSFSSSRLNRHSNHNDHRLIVVGSGVAGSATALIAAELYKIPVTMMYAGNAMTDCNSFWAQGGIIYRNYNPASNDSAELLAQDIHRAGAGLCQPEAVSKVATEGPDRVRQLLLDATSKFAQVPFDRDAVTNELSLCLEASHAAPRILHKADHTGAVITQHLTAAAANHPLITQQPNTIVTDLIVQQQSSSSSGCGDDAQERICVGVQTMDRTTGKQSLEYATGGTVLCSGGLAGIYKHSTNPAGFNALGSSVALATRADVLTQDLEYVQFHPTALYMPNEARFLLTEALRGEGGILRDATGRAFATDYHPDGELAPRDVVARAVFEETQKNPQKHNAFLDISHRDSAWLHERFPKIQEHLSQRNLDLGKDALPVIPAAHYTCGGISTDLNGRTSLKGLYAAGEAARTGLHGGNRLASTSLLEGLVFGASVADFIGGTEGGMQVQQQAADSLHDMLLQHDLLGQRKQEVFSRGHYPRRGAIPEPVHIETAAHRAMVLLRDIRTVMWDYVGVTRTPNGLETALEDLREIQTKVDHLYRTCPTLETAAVRDAVCAGYAVTQAALANRVSRGAHFIVADAETDSDDELVAEAAR